MVLHVFMHSKHHLEKGQAIKGVLAFSQIKIYSIATKSDQLSSSHSECNRVIDFILIHARFQKVLSEGSNFDNFFFSLSL